MNNPLIDHSWKSIVNIDAGGQRFAQAKLAQIQVLHEQIADQVGSDTASSVLGAGNIENALRRCVQFYEENSWLDESDLYIFHEYATIKAEIAQEIIDSDLGHLNL